MALLTTKKLFYIFQEYEPSKLLTWEIVRSFHPTHISVLLYILENVKNSSKLMPYAHEYVNYRKYVDNDEEFNRTNVIFKTDMKTKLTLLKVNSNRIINYINDDVVSKLYETHDELDCTTIIGLFFEILEINAKPEHEYNLDINDRIMLNNLCTNEYGKFVKNVEYFLLPDDMQNDRNKHVSIHDRRSVTERFREYFHCLHRQGINRDLYYSGNMDVRSFRSLNRIKCKLIYERPIREQMDYIIQPLYRGYRVVINYNEHETRVYNTYSELLQGFLYTLKLNVPVTFEAIIMPNDKNGNPCAWMYAPISYGNYTIAIVDIFRINDKLLLNEPFENRIKYIRKLCISEKCRYRDSIKLILCDNRNLETNSWDKIYHDNCEKNDLLKPIVGVVFRRKLALCEEAPDSLYFPLNTFYDTLTNNLKKVDGDVSTRNYGQLRYNLDMSDNRTVCIVYAHDKNYYYVCKFDRFCYHFIHAARIERLSDIERKTIKYRQEPLFVLNAMQPAMGILLLRVYYNVYGIKNYKIVGCDVKLTTSIFDIPYNDELFFD